MVDVGKTEHRRSYFKAHTTVDRVQLARLATDSGVIRKKAFFPYFSISRRYWLSCRVAKCLLGRTKCCLVLCRVLYQSL